MKSDFWVKFSKIAEKCPTKAFDPANDVSLKVIFYGKDRFPKKHFFYIFFGVSNFLRSSKIDFLDF